MIEAQRHAVPGVTWTPNEVIDEQWEQLTAPRREQERLEAEQRAAETRRRAEIAARKRSHIRTN
jgi:hypothetical protein